MAQSQSQSEPGNQHNRCALWGVVVSSSRPNAEGTKIELVRDGEARAQTTRVIQGKFDFQAIHPGMYHFRVIDPYGKVVIRKTTRVKGIGDFVVIYVPYSMAEPQLKYLVSRTELKHKTPRQARNAFRAALKADELGNVPQSIAAFEKAVTLDPQFIEAEMDLAIQYSRSRQHAQAIAHAQRAFEIRRGDPDAARTVAMISLNARQYAQIETVARLMLSRQQAVSEMHGMLAISLVGQRRNLDEAFAHLELAAEKFPMARLLIATTLVEAGFPKLAAVQIDDYLKSSANECERESLGKWVSSLGLSESTIASIP